MERRSDVVVVGCGAAGLTAGLAARLAGAAVINLEVASRAERGGNTVFSGGSLMVPHDGLQTLGELNPDVPTDELEQYVMSPYTEEAYLADIERVTCGYTDRELAETLVKGALETAHWLQGLGYKFQIPAHKGHTARSDGKRYIDGATSIASAEGAGFGMIEQLAALGESNGVEYLYETKALRLLQDAQGRIAGVSVQGPEGIYDIHSKAVVLAAGGFESNRALRAQYLGPQWTALRPRATRFNQGRGVMMGLEVGAKPAGDWSTCHAAPSDWYAIHQNPEGKNPKAPEGVPWHRAGMHTSLTACGIGITVNERGERFFDEAQDFYPNLAVTYAAAIADQPNQTAWQIYDERVAQGLLDGKYSFHFGYAHQTPVTADTAEELAKALGAPALAGTIEEYNAASSLDEDALLDTAVLDGHGTTGLELPKSNWAKSLGKGPFVAFKVSTGITFTFGGLGINSNAQVLDTEDRVIPGLYAAGNTVGIWHRNYPGGASLTSAATFGRIAGAHAAGI